MELQYQEITARKQNRKERRLAIKSALADKANEKSYHGN